MTSDPTLVPVLSVVVVRNQAATVKLLAGRRPAGVGTKTPCRLASTKARLRWAGDITVGTRLDASGAPVVPMYVPSTPWPEASLATVPVASSKLQRKARLPSRTQAPAGQP